MEFSRQGYWSGLPFPSPQDLPNPGIKPGLPHCRQTLYHLSHQGSQVLVCKCFQDLHCFLGSVVVAHGLIAPRYMGSSRTRNQTHVLCTHRWILNYWTTREVQDLYFFKISIKSWQADGFTKRTLLSMFFMVNISRDFRECPVGEMR